MIEEEKDFEISSILDINEEEIKFICQDWLPIPLKTVSMILAEGGVGKSWIAIQAAMRYVKGEDGVKAFLWLSEDPSGITKSRASSIAKKILNTDFQKFRNVSICGSERSPLGIVYNDKKFKKFKEALKDYTLIILDPLIGFFDGNENSNSEAKKFMVKFTQWATDENKAIVFIHHVDKKAGKSRGASAFRDAARLLYDVEKDENNSSQLKFSFDKDNYNTESLLKEIPFTRVIFPSISKTRKKR